MRLALGLHTRDSTSGFRAYRLEALQRIGLTSLVSEGYAFQIEVVHRITNAFGRRAVAEVPITFRDRAAGKSKMSWRISVEAVRRVTRWAIDDRASR